MDPIHEKKLNHRESKYLRKFIQSFVDQGIRASGPVFAMARKLEPRGYLVRNAADPKLFWITRKGVNALIAHDKALMQPENMRLLRMIREHEETGKPDGLTLVMMPGTLATMIDSGIVICTNVRRKTYEMSPDFRKMQKILKRAEIPYLC